MSGRDYPHDDDIERKVTELLTRLDGGVSHAEIARHYPELSGDYCITFDDRPNTVLFALLSQACVDTISWMILHERAHLRPTEYMVYMIDGGVIGYPIAKRIRKTDYKTPHWLPCTLYPGKRPPLKDML